MEARGVRIDNVAKDCGVKQREDLIDGGEDERGGYEAPVISQVAIKSRHLSIDDILRAADALN
jgi:hypothetical protein